MFIAGCRHALRSEWPFIIIGTWAPLTAGPRTESRCEVPSIVLGVAPWWCRCMPLGSACDGATGLWVFTVVAFCAAWNGGVWRCGELRLRSTSRYRLVCNWFPAPGGGLPPRPWPPMAWDYPGSRVPFVSNHTMSNNKA